MGLVKIILLLILLNVVLFTGYWIYQNLPGEIQELTVVNLGPSVDGAIINVSGELVQFYPGMRFNHKDIRYYIHPGCSSTSKERVAEAFSIVSSGTGIISFQKSLEDNADILVACSPEVYQKEENIFIAGEGGPTKIINASIPVIVRGKLTFYNDTSSDCEYPVTELHEIFHVFGFDHINDSSTVLYPFIKCDQRVSMDLLSALRFLYTIEPLPDLYFEEIVASKSGRYLSFDTIIVNDGLIDAENSVLSVYVEGELVDSFILNTVSFGGGQKFYVKNLKLPTRITEEVELRVNSTTKDYNEINNVVKLKV